MTSEKKTQKPGTPRANATPNRQPATAAEHRALVRAAAQDVAKRFAPMLRKLADS